MMIPEVCQINTENGFIVSSSSVTPADFWWCQRRGAYFRGKVHVGKVINCFGSRLAQLVLLHYSWARGRYFTQDNTVTMVMRNGSHQKQTWDINVGMVALFKRYRQILYLEWRATELNCWHLSVVNLKQKTLNSSNIKSILRVIRICKCLK